MPGITAVFVRKTAVNETGQTYVAWGIEPSWVKVTFCPDNRAVVSWVALCFSCFEGANYLDYSPSQRSGPNSKHTYFFPKGIYLFLLVDAILCLQAIYPDTGGIPPAVPRPLIVLIVRSSGRGLKNNDQVCQFVRLSVYH